MRFGVARDAWRWPALLLLVALAPLGAALASTAPTAWRAECIGYYTVRLPGDIEYAIQRPPLERDWNPQFSDGLGVWGTSFRVTLDDQAEKLAHIEISSEVSRVDLDGLANARNKAQQKSKDESLRKARLFAGDSDDFGKRFLREAEAIRFFEPYFGGQVYAIGKDSIGIYALLGGRIVHTRLEGMGAPQQTIDAFLKRYHSRAPFQIPQEAGVCLPYAFITAETQPANVGISLRLKDRPDIVIYLRDGKDLSASEPPKSAKAYLSKAVHNFFYGAKLANPLDGDLKPFRDITIDGRQGLGGFALLTRDKLPGPEAFNNAANKDQDWGYLAYVPADANAPPGMSSELVFKVERFGRFAKQPMTEKEFRELVKNLAAGIKRRPGAWIPR